ncbi:NADP-dependent oxidoreductase domain-containing protein [Diaporthe sp. PMI_573]|nr:NADP-dependent oxidoreductase domain-containing protein [Diaporthaceae sp. PMI_573]
MGRLIYGTAWKKDDTDKLVYCALEAGFRAISTAAQPENYEEALVAQGVGRAINAGVVPRRDVSIQTTFTPAHSQAIKTVVKTTGPGLHPGWPCPQRTSTPSDCPYDPATSLAEQVHHSVASSLSNFAIMPSSPGDVYIDAVILHAPYPAREHTEAVWTALSAHVPHHVRRLGISNVDDEELQHLLDFCAANPAAAAAPAIVQNRFRGCHRDDNFDAAVRQICKENGIEYQAFGVLREKALLQDQQSVGAVADLAFASREASLYALVMALQDDMAVLDGTSKPSTMWADINDIKQIGCCAESPEWKRALESFEKGIH